MRQLAWIVLVGVAMCACFAAGKCCGEGKTEGDTLSVRVDSFVDTVVVEKHDTLPLLRTEKVVCYVPVSEAVRDTIKDSVSTDDYDAMLAVVQREYSDDSTYTAWVSGVRYDVWPKLDSISVRRREVVRTVRETVTLADKRKARRLSVGVVGGYGYGLGYGGFEPFVGLGVSYRIFPP